MYLPISNLEPYMPVIEDYDLALLQSKINIYSNQLNDATNNIFVFTPNSEFVIHNQRTVMLSFPAFQDDNNLKFFLAGQELTPDKYIKIKPKFDVAIQGVKQARPVTRIKLINPIFPEHFDFVVKGNQCWSNGIPDELYFVLLEILSFEIKYNPLINPKNEFRLNTLNIQSEKVGTRYISYTENTRYKDLTDVLNFGVNAPKYNLIISKYRNESTNFYNTISRDNCDLLNNLDFIPYNTF